MPDIEEMVLAISQIEQLLGRLEDYQNQKIIRGKLLDTEEFIDETRISLKTALQVLEKRVGFHLEKVS